MRRVDVPEAFARKLAWLRARAREKRLYQAPPEDEPHVRVQELETIERETGIELPDRAVAYVAAAVSAWGDGPVTFGKIVEQTLGVREFAVEQGMKESAARRFVVIDDDSNGNYIAVTKGTPKDSDRVYFLDHEGGFESQIALSLERSIDERLEGFVPPGPIAPFRFTLVADDGEHVTIAFETAGTKRLKRSFVSFD